MEGISYQLLAMDALAHSLLLINGGTGQIVSELPYSADLSPIDLAVTADGSKAYIPADANGEGVLLAANLRQQALYRLPLAIPSPSQFSLSPDGQSAFVATAEGSLHRLDLVSLSVTPCGAPGSPETYCVGIQTDGNTLYSIWEHPGGGSFAAFDHQGQLLYEQSIPGIPTNLTQDSHGHFIIPFTSESASGEGIFLMSRQPEASAIEATATILYCNCQSSSIPCAYPSHAAFSPDGHTAYIVNEESASITVIDIPTATVTGRIPVGRSISCLHLLPGGNFAIASSHMFADLSLIDLVNGRLLSITDMQREFLGYIAVLPSDTQ
ncbi:hypothetical protein [Propionispora hippei]|uniref:40-residue YVTN family beta-propeller repeat-containing protein n=1 Tax=Propionispora hippei DSM 15287 TaxID=1123003 RepID=A0A1M6F8B7_9FIRM|nr:hypothetical protein [Propionispora hippei]SHI93891.1 40-residue YVTN family beta-propeller repeat-containing protein [Propionispora hippei DSM 15287]